MSSVHLGRVPLHDPALDLFVGAHRAGVGGRPLGIGNLMVPTPIAIPVVHRCVAALANRDPVGERTGGVFLTSNNRTVIAEMPRAA